MKVLKEKPLDDILRKKSETTLINLLFHPESVDFGTLDECSIRIMDLARSHLMVPSLFSRLSNCSDALIKSTSFFRNLAEETLHESKRVLSITHQLNVLFGEIETAKIRCCLMKGLAAA
ncbi:MAG: nucleotidyltransferase family protein, partial [SAR324 cluster bacterium]|nr:nucleotidyltransferase family protein [SAR324 cluster bacterium]